jgi:hypothetical protein
MYVLAPNQIVENFPYSIGDLRKDNPQVSFPANPSLATLAAYNVFPVVSTGAQYDPATQVATQEGCNYTGFRWETAWTVRDMTADEVANRNAGQAASVRAERNDKLASTDWTQLADSTADKAAWATYRQALRDVTEQSGFPWTIDWPTQP